MKSFCVHFLNAPFSQISNVKKANPDDFFNFIHWIKIDESIKTLLILKMN